MISWLPKFRQSGKEALRKGLVREVEFHGPTYQIEVYDPEASQSFWPFFQFNEKTDLQDAFCSCPLGEEGCWHLAAGYLRIYEHGRAPLHIRFQNSFWNVLCQRFAEHIGYDVKDLKTDHVPGHFFYDNDLSFEIRFKEGANVFLEKRQKETPENSLRFSNFSQEEIIFWKEGRPSLELRYALSFWSDLAKKMFFSQELAKISFEESEDLPRVFLADFPSFMTRWSLSYDALEQLIPKLDTIKSPLKLYRAAEETVVNIFFDAKTFTLHLEHQDAHRLPHLQKARHIGHFAYVKGEGFYYLDGDSLLNRKTIAKQEVNEFIEKHGLELARFIPVHEKPMPLSYEMFFDEEWNWHFQAYLFAKKDLLDASAALYGSLAYLSSKGFFFVENVLFNEPVMTILSKDVSRFINHNKVFLSSQDGFQTHLSSVESHLEYSVTAENMLTFQSKTYKGGRTEKDFGDWVYYENLGFFSKKHLRLGLAVRPGLRILPYEVAGFIKANRDELEAIPNFFTDYHPLIERYLEIGVTTLSEIYVKPIDITKENAPPYRYFDDFIFCEGWGFCELPAQLRLPEDYREERVISQGKQTAFFSEELPFLMKYAKQIDERLLPPHKTEYELAYLARLAKGGLKAELFLHSEKGRISIADIYEGFEKKKKYLFSQAGLIDLSDPNYQWIKTLHGPVGNTKSFEISTWEFLRLDATLPLRLPGDGALNADVTRQIVRELREFSTHETPNLIGLKSELRLYQQTGLSWLWFLYKNGLSGILCDDMGLGKTHQAMALVAAILNQKSSKKKLFLVVCPTSVIYHWQDKLETFLPKLKVHTFHGQRRSLKGAPKEGIILTTYGIVRVEKKALEQIAFEVVIFDEVQTAKNTRSRVHHALLHLKARMRIGLTGTPIENNLNELKALFDIVLPGYMPGDAKFREQFLHPIERGNSEEKRAELSALIKPFTLRRRKTEVLRELPEKSVDKSYCELSNEQTELYLKTLARKKESVMAQLSDHEAEVNYVHIFALLSELKQICDHPALFLKDVENYKYHTSGKWELFTELLEEARESDQKIVVFSQYLLMLDIIEEYLKEKGWGYAQIRGSTLDRKEQLKKFQEDPECVVFIGSLQAAGVGIDLTAASVVILYDRWWNAAKENQAVDRVHRIGQKWGVQVYKLITKETIEEKIDLMISKKGRLLEKVVTADDEGVLKRFSREELIELLSFQWE